MPSIEMPDLNPMNEGITGSEIIGFFIAVAFVSLFALALFTQPKIEQKPLPQAEFCETQRLTPVAQLPAWCLEYFAK